MAIALSEPRELTAGPLPETRDILDKFTPAAGQLIPILQQVQERFGYLPEPALLEIADFLRLPPSKVYGVATFYALFKLQPSGRKVIKVCRGTACHVRGGARVLREVEKQLGIKPGETTPDYEYTLETVACLGACALAPTMVIGKDTYGQVNPARVAELLGKEGDTEAIPYPAAGN